MPEQRVVVEADLRVQRHQIARLGHDQRIDLRQAAIQFDEQPAQWTDELLGRAYAGAGQAELSTQFPHLIRLNPGVWMKRFFENQLGRFGGNFLDVHAARAAGHQHRHRRCAIDDDAEVQLPGDVAAGFDQHAANCLTGRAGLNCDQFVAQQLAGHGGGFFRASHELHAVLLRVVLDRALTSAAGVNLGFYYRNGAAQRAKRGRRLFRRARHDAIGQRDARLAQ